MPAPIGNSNAQKWTLEKTDETLKHIETYADREAVYYLGQALAIAGVYSDLWAYWKRKWHDHDDIIDRMRVVEQQFEAKITVGALLGRLHPGVSMLCLKHNYGWSGYKKAPEPPIEGPRTPYDPASQYTTTPPTDGPSIKISEDQYLKI